MKFIAAMLMGLLGFALIGPIGLFIGVMIGFALFR